MFFFSEKAGIYPNRLSPTLKSCKNREVGKFWKKTRSWKVLSRKRDFFSDFLGIKPEKDRKLITVGATTSKTAQIARENCNILSSKDVSIFSLAGDIVEMIIRTNNGIVEMIEIDVISVHTYVMDLK